MVVVQFVRPSIALPGQSSSKYLSLCRLLSKGLSKVLPRSDPEPDNRVVLTLADGPVASAKTDGPVISWTVEPDVWENECTQLF
jgi:hypothetical protein